MKVVKLDNNATVPTRKHPTDAGLDFYSLHTRIIPPNGTAILQTGIAIDIPVGYFGLLKPKGGSDFSIGAGVVDAGYQGEILVKVINHHTFAVPIYSGEAIAQLVVVPILTPNVEQVSYEEFQHTTDRGATGGIVTQLKTATFTSETKED